MDRRPGGAGFGVGLLPNVNRPRRKAAFAVLLVTHHPWFQFSVLGRPSASLPERNLAPSGFVAVVSEPRADPRAVSRAFATFAAVPTAPTSTIRANEDRELRGRRAHRTARTILGQSADHAANRRSSRTYGGATVQIARHQRPGTPPASALCRAEPRPAVSAIGPSRSTGDGVLARAGERTDEP